MSTELDAGPSDLPWMKNGYLLLSGVIVGDLLKRIFQWNPQAECIALYAGTRFRGIVDISPYLVQLSGPDDPVLREYVENARLGWGSLMFSEAGLFEVVTHLRWLTTVTQADAPTLMLNLSDPAVADALYEHDPDGRLFGPIQHVVVPDRLNETWEHHARVGDAPVANYAQPYALSALQSEALDEVDFRRVVRNLHAHMRTCFPDFLPHLSEIDQIVHCSRLARHAYYYGFHSEMDLAHYLNVMQFVGDRPLDDFPEIADLLNKSSALTPSQRVQQANQRVCELSRVSTGGQA